MWLKGDGDRIRNRTIDTVDGHWMQVNRVVVGSMAMETCEGAEGSENARQQKRMEIPINVNFSLDFAHFLVYVLL